MQVGSVKENYLYLKKYQSLDKAFKRGVMKLSGILMSLWNIIISLCFVQHLSQKKKWMMRIALTVSNYCADLP